LPAGGVRGEGDCRQRASKAILEHFCLLSQIERSMVKKLNRVLALVSPCRSKTSAMDGRNAQIAVIRWPCGDLILARSEIILTVIIPGEPSR
jgi:hypothetical protein